MAFDLCIDKNLFLDTTCRTCSRFFSEDVKFYKIFEEKLKTTTNEGGGAVDGICSSTSLQAGGEVKENKVYETCEDIKEILEDLNIWKLNVSIWGKKGKLNKFNCVFVVLNRLNHLMVCLNNCVRNVSNVLNR